MYVNENAVHSIDTHIFSMTMACTTLSLTCMSMQAKWQGHPCHCLNGIARMSIDNRIGIAELGLPKELLGGADAWARRLHP
jgi:hypothetical protein